MPDTSLPPPSAALLAAALENADSCMAVMVGPELRYAFVNRAFASIVPQVQMTGKRFREVFPEATATGAEARFLRTLETGEPWVMERYHAPVAGNPDALWEGVARRLPPAPGEPAAILVVATDVTDRARMETVLRDTDAALVDANRRLQAVIESITDGLAVLDRDWCYTYFSETGARMLHVRREDLLGKCIWDVFPYARDSTFGREYRRAVDTGEPTHFEEYYPAPLDMWVECHCYPSREGLSVFFRDVTPRKQAEEQLREADRRKDEYMATLAHELRNPLAPLRSSLTLLRHAQLEPDRHAYVLQIMERQLAHMVRLIDDLLDTSRLATGKLRVDLKELDFAGVVRHALESLQATFAANAQHVDLRLPASRVVVSGDGIRLDQVVTNLLTNAAKFTPHGGRITVALESGEDGTRLDVTDTGMGIPPDKLEAIFDLFSQLQPAGKSAGLGIGLNLARRLVELHGGTLTAISEGTDRGSTFTVRLPRHGP